MYVVTCGVHIRISLEKKNVIFSCKKEQTSNDKRFKRRGMKWKYFVSAIMKLNMSLQIIISKHLKF